MFAGLGEQCSRTRQQIEAAWAERAARTVDYRDPSVGFATHAERWWRGPRLRG